MEQYEGKGIDGNYWVRGKLKEEDGVTRIYHTKEGVYTTVDPTTVRKVMEKSALLTPTVLEEDGWDFYQEKDGFVIYHKKHDNLLIIICLTALHRYGEHDEWLIRNTSITSVQGIEETPIYKVNINIPSAITIEDFNNIFDGVKLPKFKFRMEY